MPCLYLRRLYLVSILGTDGAIYFIYSFLISELPSTAATLGRDPFFFLWTSMTSGIQKAVILRWEVKAPRSGKHTHTYTP